MKKQIIALNVILFFTLVVTSCGSKNSTQQAEPSKTEQTAVDTTGVSQPVAAVYQCPMKCEGKKTYDTPGSCPVCKMDLKKVDANHEHHNHDSTHINH